MRPARLLTTLAALAPIAGGLAAQSIGIGVNRWLTDPHVTDYRVSLFSYRLGPITVLPFAQATVQGPRDAGAFLVGGGGDAMIRITPDARPYLVGGLSVGFLDFRRSLGVTTWSAWSAGAGIELFRALGAGVSLEGRYQRLSRERTGGISLGIRLGTALGRESGGSSNDFDRRADRSDEPASRRPAPESRPADRSEPVNAPRAAEPAPRQPTRNPALATVSGAAAASEAVRIARGAMGAPYRWGGSDANGFDCSGLIYYAYGEVGIALPRRSVDQANAGRSVGAALAELQPGDVLVFSREPGGEVSHVGLYLGEGRFIHSASKGIGISRLAPDDPAGRWWFDRWVDSRRIAE